MCYFFKTRSRYFHHTSGQSPCCNSLCRCGLNILLLSSRNIWASAIALHLGRHAHPGNGSAGQSNHTTTSLETCAACLKIVLGLTESMGEAGICAAYKSTSKPSPCGHKHQQMCCSQCTSKPSPCGAQAAGLCGGVLVKNSWGSSTLLWCKTTHV